MERLRDDKAARAEDLAPSFPNSIKGGISYPLTLSFREYCRMRKFLMIGLKLIWYQFLREEIGVYHQTIDL